MLIIGAGGLAKEVLEILHQRGELNGIHFYDDTPGGPSFIYSKFPVLKNMEQVAALFKMDNRYIVGVGNPSLREQFNKRFGDAGGELVSAVSPYAQIGNYGTMIANGAIIMAGTIITNDVKIGLSCLINPNCTISHDSTVGNFVDISPGAQITGNTRIGNFCSIGTNATILPQVVLGDYVTVGAGAVVLKAVSKGLTVGGVPAKSLH